METASLISNQSGKGYRPVALASDIDFLKFTVGYCIGQELWWALGHHASVKHPGALGRGAEALGVCKGYTDAREGVKRHFWYGTIEAYNEVVLERRPDCSSDGEEVSR